MSTKKKEAVVEFSDEVLEAYEALAEAGLLKGEELLAKTEKEAAVKYLEIMDGITDWNERLEEAVSLLNEKAEVLKIGHFAFSEGMSTADKLVAFKEIVDTIPNEKEIEEEVPEEVGVIWNLLNSKILMEEIFDDSKAGDEKPTENVPASAKGKGRKEGKKTPAAKKEEGKKKEAAPPVKGALNEKLLFMREMIKQGTFTKKEIVAAAVDKFRGKDITYVTYLTDAKNTKYNKYSQLVVEVGGKLKFKEE